MSKAVSDRLTQTKIPRPGGTNPNPPQMTMKTSARLFCSLLALAAGLFLSLPTQAQILVSAGTTYSTNFDGLASSGTVAWADNSTLTGWYAAKQKAGAITTYTAGTGADSTAGLHSFGASGSTSTNRALGSLVTSTPGDIAYGIRFTNDTTLVVSNLTISYSGEQWRRNNNTNNLQTLAFSYVISNSAITNADPLGTNYSWIAFTNLDFISPQTNGTGATASFDGHNATNSHLFSNILLPTVLVLPGQEFFFRWLDIDDSTGTDHSLAIDDFTLTFITIAVANNPPSITAQPQNATNNIGDTATFTVGTTSTQPMFYQWHKGLVDLVNGSNISGATTPTLTISNVTSADVANYSVTITNNAGPTNSVAAHLTVLEPAFSTQLVSRTNVAGDTLDLFARVIGTSPITNQWFHNGILVTNGFTNFPGTTASFVLQVTNFQATNAGSYWLVTSDAFGVTTSAVVNAALFLTPSNRLARWDFNDTNSPVTSPDPSEGAGTATLLGNVPAVYSPTASFADPLAATNFSWNTGNNYPLQGTSNELAGVEFQASTVGKKDIVLTWNEYHTKQASRYTRLQYSADGVNFTNRDVYVTTNDSDFAFYSADLSAITNLNNNPNFAFRIVTDFESTAITNGNANYVATTTGSSYSVNGTIRFDLMSVYANTISTVVTLKIQKFGTNTVLSWNDPSLYLQSSPTLKGNYAPVCVNYASPTSPFTNTFPDTTQFYKLGVNNNCPGPSIIIKH
jgi:hypothetical protein